MQRWRGTLYLYPHFSSCLAGGGMVREGRLHPRYTPARPQQAVLGRDPMCHSVGEGGGKGLKVGIKHLGKMEGRREQGTKQRRVRRSAVAGHERDRCSFAPAVLAGAHPRIGAHLINSRWDGGVGVTENQAAEEGGWR